MLTKKATKYGENKARVCRLKWTPHSGNKRSPSICLCWNFRSVKTSWTSLLSGLPLLKQNSEKYKFVQFGLYGKFLFLSWYYTNSSFKPWFYLLSGAETCRAIWSFSDILTEYRSNMGPTQPPIKWVPKAPTPGVKLPGFEAHYLPPFSVEVWNDGAIPTLFHVFKT
jgi:hypothetical protein